MITLFGAGPRFGLPDPSPFVMKTEVLLKMAGVPYRTAKANFRKAPKGKIPYIEDNGEIVGDSTFIRRRLEEKHGAVFDKSLSAADKAIAWAFEKLCEEHLYWVLVYERWMNAENFEKGPRLFFEDIPAFIRPLVIAIIRRSVKNNLWGHGMGRHTGDEALTLGVRDIDAIAAFLADKPWLMGEEPCGADASVFASVAGALCDHFESRLRTAAEGHANLIAYRDRGMARWFPEFAPPPRPIVPETSRPPG